MQYKTPGIYIKDLTPPQSAIPFVETALPVFIGYTEEAKDGAGKDLSYKAFRVRDLEHYISFFKGAYRPRSYEIEVDPQNEHKVLSSKADKRFFLYDCIQQYFDNGGGDCFIISLGNYKEAQPKLLDFQKALEAASKTPEITLILYPDSVLLEPKDLGALQQASLQHCFEHKNRFLIADIKEADRWEEGVQDFRNNVGINQLRYGAAYFPWLFSTYDHAFYFRELRFRDIDTGNLIQDDSVFSSSADLDLARKHQEMLSQLKLRGEYVEKILKCLSGFEISRENFSPLSQEWNKRAREFSIENSKGEDPENKAEILLTQNLEFLSQIILSFPKLETDEQFPDELNDYLFELKSKSAFTEVITASIGLHKAVEDEGLLIDEVEQEDIVAAYTALSGTNWLQEGTVEEVPLVLIEGEDASSKRNFVQKQASEYARVLAVALSSLFDLALSHEALAEEQLFSQHPFFKQVFEHLSLQLKRLPPSAAIAGVYSATDRLRGVFKAPANVILEATLGPVIEIDDRDQEGLNVHSTGKSINVIRPMRGRGIRIWGARTLAGNDNEWRYVPVRRFFNYVEDFVKLAAEPFVFEPNDANTWTRLRFLIDNFLTAQWRKGALAGITTEEAFFVNVGLNETMSQQDILEGRMIIEVGLAATRPAEFIVIRYLCRMENN